MLRKRSIIVYHGTKVVEARKILKEGFKEGTYFAKHLEDAIGYGGNYVFEVAYLYSMTSKLPIIFRCQQNVPSEFIVQLTRYNPSKVIIDNMVLRHRVKISNSTKAEIEYIRQDMRNKSTGYSRDELIAYGMVEENAKG